MLYYISITNVEAIPSIITAAKQFGWKNELRWYNLKSNILILDTSDKSVYRASVAPNSDMYINLSTYGNLFKLIINGTLEKHLAGNIGNYTYNWRSSKSNILTLSSGEANFNIPINELKCVLNQIDTQ